MESVASVSASVWLMTISCSWERLTVRGVVAPSRPSARRQLGAVALRTMQPVSVCSRFSVEPASLWAPDAPEAALSCEPERALTVMVRLPSGAASTAIAMTNKLLSISCPPVQPPNSRGRNVSSINAIFFKASSSPYG